MNDCDLFTNGFKAHLIKSVNNAEFWEESSYILISNQWRYTYN